jgi:hypothetical protein
MSAIFTGTWDTGWCDPAPPTRSPGELRNLGFSGLVSRALVTRDDEAPVASGGTTFSSTRLHVRYDAAHFPEDLVFRRRRSLELPGTVKSCGTSGRRRLVRAATRYRAELPQRYQREAQSLASLTGWDINDIRRSMKIPPTPAEPVAWWQKIWK